MFSSLQDCRVEASQNQMNCSWPEAMVFDRRKAAEELIRGREFAQQLQLLLRRSGGDTTVAASQDLLSRILNSFSKSLSMLNRASDYDDINGSTANSPASSRDARKLASDESEESSKSSTIKDRRGCYKRRRNSSHSWTRESSALIDDGYAWRKYGQKVILNAKFPRNYFRCTHKFEQGCQATKQVQRVEDDPPKYCTTYYGHHSCTNFLKAASEIVLDSTFHDSSGVVLRFDSPLSAISSGQHQQLDQHDTVDGANYFSVKEEIKEESVQNQLSSSSNYIMSPEDHFTACSFDQSEHGDVFSEVMMSSVVDFDDDVLQFEF